jgi:hypothetical protein
MTTNATTTAVLTNAHDHTIGHCRAQRHSLYCDPTCPARIALATTTSATNLNDHTIGHCRAQRQDLYCYPHAELAHHEPIVVAPIAVPSVVTKADDDWTESKEELGRWGMNEEVVKKEGKTADLKIEEVEKFWQ